tara:strand:+ start:1235 stop:1657 length:423 start_codon:yes stop_codon:yes gene_type:complete
MNKQDFINNMKNVETIQWIAPRIIKMTTSGNKVTMDVDYRDEHEPHDSITISRVKNGYVMTDPGLFTRTFSTAEGLRYEFEYPSSFVDVLKSLPIGTDKTKEFVDYQKIHDYNMEMYMRNFHTRPTGGSNVTPKKKKRKK